MRRTGLLIVLLLACLTVSAQYKSRLGRFQVDQIKGCAPLTVTITNANLLTTNQCTGPAPCLMDYEAKGSQQNVFTYTYTTPGTFKLSVLYQSIGSDDITITVDQAISPNFDIYACAGNKVTVKVQDTNYDQYVIDFQNDGTPETVIPSGNNATAQFAYPSAGTYNIMMRGRDLNSADNCPNNVQAFATFNTLPAPALTALTTTDGTSLKIDMNTVNHIQYKLEIAVNNATTFQVLQNLYNAKTTNVGNLLTDNNYYCFRLSAFDPCTGGNTYSNTICSQDFDVAFNNGSNDLTWKTSTSGVTSVQILRNKTALTTFNSPVLSYKDVDYTCNQDYCYQIIVGYAGGAKSTSLEKCGKGILKTTYPAIDNLTASVETTGTLLTWKADPTIKVKEFEVMRSENGAAFTQITAVTTPPFKDLEYQTDLNLCYQINYGDACDNRSAEGIIACPVRLMGTMDDSNIISLEWTKYLGWKNGTSTYLLYKYDSKGNVIKVTSFGSETTFIDDESDAVHQVVSYVIEAYSFDTGVGVARSNMVTFTKGVNLRFPTGFTPNGDALNPTFSVSGQFVAKMNIKIFDRWGVMVYASDTSEPWDGTRSGKPLPQSTYVWKAEITDYTGKTFSEQGTVLLLRP